MVRNILLLETLALFCFAFDPPFRRTIRLVRAYLDLRPFCRCQASKTAFRSRCARPGGTLHVSEAFCPNIQPRAHARLTGLTN